MMRLTMPRNFIGNNLNLISGRSCTVQDGTMTYMTDLFASSFAFFNS